MYAFVHTDNYSVLYSRTFSLSSFSIDQNFQSVNFLIRPTRILIIIFLKIRSKSAYFRELQSNGFH